MHFRIRSKTGQIIISKECGKGGRPAIVGSAKIDFPKVHEHVTMQELFEGQADAPILQGMKELLELMQLRTVEQTADSSEAPVTFDDHIERFEVQLMSALAPSKLFAIPDAETSRPILQPSRNCES